MHSYVEEAGSQILNEQAVEKTNACHLMLVADLKYLKLIFITPPKGCTIPSSTQLMGKSA